ncbi:MAG TPA: hypothetical protein VF092_01300, partial [Longimicrobium sp.]
AEAGASVPRLPVRAPLRGHGRRDGGLRVTRWSVALSLAAHVVLAVVLILGINEVTRREARTRTKADQDEQVSYLDVTQWPSDASSAGAAAAPAGTPSAAAQAVTNAAIDSALARIPELQRFPDRVPTRIPPAPAGNGAGPAGGQQPGVANGAPGGSGNAIGNDVAGGPLGAGYGDRRLIVRPEAVPERQKTEHERYMEHLGSALGVWNDSVADEAARQRRARNWTIRDRNGREWGIGDGGVPIVAGHRLPTRVAPPIHVDRDQEEAAREQSRQRREIERQAEDTDRDRSFRDRTRAIRQRQDEERRKRREGSGQQDGSSSSSPSSSSPSSTPPGGTP